MQIARDFAVDDDDGKDAALMKVLGGLSVNDRSTLMSFLGASGNGGLQGENLMDSLRASINLRAITDRQTRN